MPKYCNVFKCVATPWKRHSRSTVVHRLWSVAWRRQTTTTDQPQAQACFLPGWLRWTLLPKEGYGDSLSGRRSNLSFQRRPLYHWAIAAPTSDWTSYSLMHSFFFCAQWCVHSSSVRSDAFVQYRDPLHRVPTPGAPSQLQDWSACHVRPRSPDASWGNRALCITVT